MTFFNTRRLNIAQRLGAGFGALILLILAITATAGYCLIQGERRIASILNERIPTTALVNMIRADLGNTIGTIRTILLNGEDSDSQVEIALIEQDHQFIEENSLKLDKAMAGSDDGRQRVAALKEVRSAFNERRDQFLNLIKEKRLAEARDRALPDVRAAGDIYLREIDALVIQQGKLSEAAGQDVGAAMRLALLVMAALAVAATLIGISVALLVTRGITAPLNGAVGMARRIAGGDLGASFQVESRDEIGQLMSALQEMNASLAGIVGEVRGGTDAIALASVEIADGTAQLSSRTEQQAQARRATAASVGQLSATVRQNADNAARASALGTNAAATAARGGEAVAQVVSTMELIKSSSRRIGDILGVIDSIAFQTNILALNAAVEAARAGDQGRGFAVVASEVRSLAHRSAEAAREIKLLIGESVQRVDLGNVLVGKAGATMDDIVDAVRNVAQLMAEITGASREQSHGIDSVTQAILGMDEITQQNAALVEEATAATEAMKHQASNLARAVSVFKLASADGPVRQTLPARPAPLSLLYRIVKRKLG